VFAAGSLPAHIPHGADFEPIAPHLPNLNFSN